MLPGSSGSSQWVSDHPFAGRRRGRHRAEERQDIEGPGPGQDLATATSGDYRRSRKIVAQARRFARRRQAGRPRFVYIPFGGGPRMCIGEPFAIMEMQLIVSTVTQRFRLHPVPDHPVEPDPVVTLRPRYGVMMTLKEQPQPEHASRRAERQVAKGTDPD